MNFLAPLCIFSQHVFEGVRINVELRQFLTCKCILLLSKRTAASKTNYCNCGRRMISFLAVSFGSKFSAKKPTAAEPGSFPVQLYPFGAWSDSGTPPGCPVLPGRHPLSSTTVAATWMHPILKKWCSPQGKAPGLSQTLTHGVMSHESQNTATGWQGDDKKGAISSWNLTCLELYCVWC